MMEVFSLHREMTGEEGEQCRVRYSLTEDSCGPERCYGILCCVEGSRRPGRCCRLPGLLENRGVGELLVEYLDGQNFKQIDSYNASVAQGTFETA